MFLKRSIGVCTGLIALAAATVAAQIQPIGTKGSYPDIQIDQDGDLHLVYARSGKTYYRVLPKNGTAFSTEEDTGVGASTDHRMQPDVAIDSRGEPHVLGGARYNVRRSGNWGTAMSPGVSRDHHMAIASNDDVWIVYRGNQLTARRKRAGNSTFDSAINIFSGGGTDHVYPDIIAGSDGKVHVVFRMRNPSNYDCGYVHYDGQQWYGVEWACRNGRPKIEEGPHVALDRNNIPWCAMPEGNLRLNHRGGGSWNNTIQTVSTTGGHTRSEPTIGIDAQDNKFIASWGGEYHAYNMATQSWFHGKLPKVNNQAIGFVDVVGTDGEGAWMVYESGPTVNKSTGAGTADLIVVKVLKDGSVVPYGSTAQRTLDVSASAISASTGGVVEFNLDASTDHRHKGYFLLGSMSGSSPGVELPGARRLPLNIDNFTYLIGHFFNTPRYRNFAGDLDSAGKASAYLSVPAGYLSGAVGVQFYFAFVTLPRQEFASNSVTLTVAP